MKRRAFVDACFDDKATLFVLFVDFLSFLIIGAGLIVYFYQYQFLSDHSDEKWLYPFIWLIPCASFCLGLYALFSSGYRKEKCLKSVSILSVLNILSLLFLFYIFYASNYETKRQDICSQSSVTQDQECVIAKDGHQICGHKAIGSLCQELEVGFYLVLMGSVLMIVTQIMFIASTCLRRSELKEILIQERYIRLKTQIEGE